MSNNSPNHYGSAFESSVIHYYQQKMKRLRHTVRHRNLAGENAKDLTFFRMGKSTVQTRARGASLSPQNQDMPSVKATPEEISGLSWVDRQDEKRMTYDNKDALAKSIAFGLARASDGLIISAGYAAEAAAVVAGRTTENYSSAFANLKHLTAIESKLSELDVPDDGMLTVLVSPAVFNNWLLFEAFSSSDWVSFDGQTLNKKTRVMGKYWNGMNILKHNGLTKSGSGASKVVECLAYHESAIGHVSLDDISIETANTLSNNKPGTNVYGFLDADAVHIDYDGVFQFTMKDIVDTA